MVDLISPLGGALSLFLGISLAMFFEIVELVIDVFGSMLRYLVKGMNITYT